jgi:uncharacterized membrane protein YdfJ with MMPL/SSD domain
LAILNLTFLALFYHVSWPPAFVIQSVNTGDGNIVCPYTQSFSKALATFQSDHADTISSVGGYWEYVLNPQTSILANQTVSPSGETMRSALVFWKNASAFQCQTASQALIDFVKDFAAKNPSPVALGVTGTFPLFNDMQTSNKADMAHTDSIVLPIALALLGLLLRSYRHIFLATLNLGCAILLGFTVMLPVSRRVAVNPSAPSVMMSLGIAVCFDYTLFILHRFREERYAALKPKDDALFDTLCASGHVVCLSGATLCSTFLVLTAFPHNFLASVGMCCSVVIFTAILASMSLTPSFLLALECLSYFEPYPTPSSCCCYLTGTVEASAARSTPPSPMDAGGRRSLWFRIAYAVTARPLLVTCLGLAATAPFLWLLVNMSPTADSNLTYLQGSQSLYALKVCRFSH